MMNDETRNDVVEESEAGTAEPEPKKKPKKDAGQKLMILAPMLFIAKIIGANIGTRAAGAPISTSPYDVFISFITCGILALLGFIMHLISKRRASATLENTESPETKTPTDSDGVLDTPSEAIAIPELEFSETVQANSAIPHIANGEDICQELPKPKVSKLPASISTKKALIALPIIFIASFLLFLAVFKPYTPTVDVPAQTPTPLPTTTPMVQQQHQTYGFPTYYSSKKCLAPFQVKLPVNNFDYYIVLVDAVTNERAVSLYLESGKEYEYAVPLGTYKLFYACGEYWDNSVNLFGETGHYLTSSAELNFYADDEYYNGITITLYPVTNGNMYTTDIDLSEFPIC